jgi:hypothetical protein
VSADGVFSVHVPRDSIISCTTTTGQQKGVAPVWPPPRFPNLAFFLFFVLSLSWQMIVFHIGLAKLWTRSNTSKFHRLSLQSSLTAHYKQFPFPYTATFDQETVHKPARFFADNDGSFEVLPSLTQVRTRFYLAIHSCKTKVIHLPRQTGLGRTFSIRVPYKEGSTQQGGAMDCVRRGLAGTISPRPHRSIPCWATETSTRSLRLEQPTGRIIALWRRCRLCRRVLSMRGMTRFLW